jgi:hypothetical protein
MAEHQVGSPSLAVRRADNHRRGFAPLRTPPSDSRRTDSSALLDMIRKGQIDCHDGEVLSAADQFYSLAF